MTRDEGKPEQAIPKIVEGRLNAFFKDVVLIEQASVRDPKTTVKQLLAEAGAAVRGFARFQIGQAVEFMPGGPPRRWERALPDSTRPGEVR